MSKTTTVRIVTSESQPLAGVQVVASDKVDHWVTTDEDGKLDMQFGDNEVFCSLVAVKLGDGSVYTVHLVLEAGETRDITVPPVA